MFMVWRVVMTFTVRSIRVMSRSSVFAMERSPEPHLGQASGVCSLNFVGVGLRVRLSWPFCPRAVYCCMWHPRALFNPGGFL